MRVAFVFHHDPITRKSGIDVVRLANITAELNRLGIETEIAAPVRKTVKWHNNLSVRPVEVLSEQGRYDLVKTCYHQSIRLVRKYSGIVISRMVRVVDTIYPVRDEHNRKELLQCQTEIAERSEAVAFNNEFNRQRWQKVYGHHQNSVLTPTGCPAIISQNRENPFKSDEKVILFIGSLASPRMAHLLNGFADRLGDQAKVVIIGRNKTDMYGGRVRLNNKIEVLGELQEKEIWPYIQYSRIGLAFAAGPDIFDNDISKIYNYLRGGLEVLMEERIVQEEMVLDLEMGEVFTYGDVSELTAKAIKMINSSPPANREKAMSYMARNHSWTKRAETYQELFYSLIESKNS